MVIGIETGELIGLQDDTFPVTAPPARLESAILDDVANSTLSVDSFASGFTITAQSEQR